MKKTLIACAALALAGCAQLKPMDFSKDAVSTEAAARKAAETGSGWEASEPVLHEGKPSVVLLTPLTIPAEILSKEVMVELEPGASVQDLAHILGTMNLSVILSDDKAAEKKFYMPRYKGTLRGLLAAVSRATDVWFTWSDGTIVISGTEKIGVTVPQEANFAEQLKKGLTSLGVEKSAITNEAGMAVLEISPSQFQKVKKYLERYTANSAVVALQVAVLNVTLNQTAKQGIDWDKLQIAALKGGNIKNLSDFSNAYKNATTTSVPGAATPGTDVSGGGTNGTGGTGSTGGTGTGTDTQAPAISDLGSVGALRWSGSALLGAIFTQRFSIEGLFSFLQSYGTAETKQNVMLKTLTGNKVEFKSLTQIPYVSEVGVTSTAGGGTNGASTTGSTQTAKADDGITVELTPTYDASSNNVTIDLKLAIKAVVAFNELSAGNQIGKLTQPTTAERSITDLIRIRPGQTVVIGGITYDSVSDNRGGPVFLTGSRLESQSLTVNRQTMFIVVRPSVTRLGQVVSKEVGHQLDIFTQAELSDADKGSLKESKPVAKSDVKVDKSAQKDATIEKHAKAEQLKAQQAEVDALQKQAALVEAAKDDSAKPGQGKAEPSKSNPGKAEASKPLVAPAAPVKAEPAKPTSPAPAEEKLVPFNASPSVGDAAKPSLDKSASKPERTKGAQKGSL